MIVVVSILLTVGAALFYNAVHSFLLIFLGGIIFSIALCLFLRIKHFVLYGICFSGCVVLGAFVMSLHEIATPSSFFGTRLVTGVVHTVDRRLDSTVLIVRDTTYNKRIRVSLEGVTPYLPGDAVSLRGTIKPVEDFVTDTERIFPYKSFLESKKVYAVMQRPQISEGVSNRITVTRLATKVRFFVADTFAQYVAFPYDGIISGMLVGYQGGISDDIEKVFQNTGTIHTLVLSGYNIMLLAGACMMLLKQVPYNIRFGITICAIIFLVVISGSGVAAVRAGIMGILALSARTMFRQYDPLRALFICFLCFFFYSPLSIFVDPGLHLSFLATFCMLAVIPKIEHLASWIPKTKIVDMRETILLSVSLPLFMLPYTIYFSGTTSLSVIAANALLSIVIPFLMCLGILVLITSFITPLATVCGAVMNTVLSISVRCLEMLERMPYYNTPPFSGWGVVAIYMLLFVFLFRKEIKEFIVRLQNVSPRIPSSSDQESL